jgi:hypothetical protein
MLKVEYNGLTTTLVEKIRLYRQSAVLISGENDQEIRFFQKIGFLKPTTPLNYI